MLEVAKQHGAWRCLANQRQLEWARDLPDIPELLEALESLPETLKNNHRSRVLRGVLNSKPLIAKQPRDKNGRIWARLLSYFELSEAAQTLLTLERFHHLKIPSVQPLFVLEKRSLGAVVDSWLCYEYREGVACDERCLTRIIELLKVMHESGFRHNDPNLGNFLLDPHDEIFILDSRGRKRAGRFSDANDFFLLKKLNKTLVDFEVSQVEHLDSTSLGFRLAKVYSRLKSARSLLKSKLKKKRPRNNAAN